MTNTETDEGTPAVEASADDSGSEVISRIVSDDGPEDIKDRPTSDKQAERRARMSSTVASKVIPTRPPHISKQPQKPGATTTPAKDDKRPYKEQKVTRFFPVPPTKRFSTEYPNKGTEFGLKGFVDYWKAIYADPDFKDRQFCYVYRLFPVIDREALMDKDGQRRQKSIA